MTILLVILTIVFTTVYMTSLYGAVNVMLDQDFQLTPAFFLMVLTPILNTIVWCRLSKKANYKNSFKETWLKIFGIVMKISNIFKIFPPFVRNKVCTHPDRRKVKLHDGIWDRMTDNDDLEDSNTIIEVEYCPDCGRILGIERCAYNDSESCWWAIDEFEQKTGIRASTVTLWK